MMLFQLNGLRKYFPVFSKTVKHNYPHAVGPGHCADVMIIYSLPHSPHLSLSLSFLLSRSLVLSRCFALSLSHTHTHTHTHTHVQVSERSGRNSKHGSKDSWIFHTNIFSRSPPRDLAHSCITTWLHWGIQEPFVWEAVEGILGLGIWNLSESGTLTLLKRG